jgi:LPS O-antigen subunit length determinant protein (WzzB/FepE family)
MIIFSLLLSQAWASTKLVCQVRFYQLNLVIDGEFSQIEMNNMFDHTNVAFGFVNSLSSSETHEQFSFNANQGGEVMVSLRPQDLHGSQPMIIALIDMNTPSQFFYESMRCIRQ